MPIKYSRKEIPRGSNYEGWTNRRITITGSERPIDLVLESATGDPSNYGCIDVFLSEAGEYIISDHYIWPENDPNGSSRKTICCFKDALSNFSSSGFRNAMLAGENEQEGEFFLQLTRNSNASTVTVKVKISEGEEGEPKYVVDSFNIPIDDINDLIGALQRYEEDG